MPVTRAETDAEIQACWPVLTQLRPHLRDEDPLPIVRKQFAEGYHLAVVRVDGKVAGVAGYRIMQNLAKGRHVYVDDLVTDEIARSRGVGAELMEWLCQFARAQGCDWLELDSGVQRFDAHPILSPAPDDHQQPPFFAETLGMGSFYTNYQIRTDSSSAKFRRMLEY